MVILVSAAKDFGPHLKEGHLFASIILTDSIKHFQQTGQDVEVTMSLEPLRGELSTIIDHNLGVTYAVQLAIQLRRALFE